MTGAVALRPRERRLALIAAVLIGCWALVSWVVQPLWERVRDVGLRVETQTQKLDALSRLLSKGPSIEQGYQSVAVYLEREDDAQVQGSFLNALEMLSRESKVELNLKPRPVKREDFVSRFEVELEAEGAQDDLLGFLDALLRMPKLIAIERLRISSVPGREQALRANLVIQKLTLHTSHP